MNNKPKTNYKGDTKKVNKVDVCQTPPHALEPLYPMLDTLMDNHPDDLAYVLWESAKGPEELLFSALNAKGYAVIGSDLSMGNEYNFFTYDPVFWDIQITNPPWSIKYEWIERSFELGKPFALLVPYETTFAAKFRKVARKYHNKPWPIEKLTPERRINFKMPAMGWGTLVHTEEKGWYMSGESAQMPTCWLTWGLNAYQHYDTFLTEYEIPMRNAKYDNDNREIIKK